MQRRASANAEPADRVIPYWPATAFYILYTLWHLRQPKGRCAVDHGGRRRRPCLQHCRWFTNMRLARVSGPPSDVGWVVGHSYIVYGPLLARLHQTRALYPKAKPIRTPECRAFLAGLCRVTASRPIVAERRPLSRDPQGRSPTRLWRNPRTCPELDAALPGRRNAWTRHLGLLRSYFKRTGIIDHWWQTENGWAILAAQTPAVTNCQTAKMGSATWPMPGL